MVFFICLLVELGPICNSMAASLCLKSSEDHNLHVLTPYLKAIPEVYEKKQLQVWAQNWKSQTAGYTCLHKSSVSKF